MRGLRGILAGSLTLIALHSLVAYRGPSQRIGDLSRLAVDFVNTFLSPNRPAIPERGAPPPMANPSGLPGLGFLPLPAPSPR